MFTTILDEAVNGWVLTVFEGTKKAVFVYERLPDAQAHRNATEQAHVAEQLREVRAHASSL